MLRYALEQHVFFMTAVLGSVGENLDVNFVMKEIPADRQFAIW
jgi:hypothetical protein